MGIDQLLSLIVYIVIIGLILWAIWWFLGTVGLPEPFNKVARVLVALVALVIVCYFLLGFLPSPGPHVVLPHR